MACWAAVKIQSHTFQLEAESRHNVTASCLHATLVQFDLTRYTLQLKYFVNCVYFLHWSWIWIMFTNSRDSLIIWPLQQRVVDSTPDSHLWVSKFLFGNLPRAFRLRKMTWENLPTSAKEWIDVCDVSVSTSPNYLIERRDLCPATLYYTLDISWMMRTIRF